MRIAPHVAAILAQVLGIYASQGAYHYYACFSLAKSVTHAPRSANTGIYEAFAAERLGRGALGAMRAKVESYYYYWYWQQ